MEQITHCEPPTEEKPSVEVTKEGYAMTLRTLRTIQKRDKLNDVCAAGRIGGGGARHLYIILRHTDGQGDVAPFAEIRFQEGPRKEPGSKTGVLDVDLLEIVRDRLMAFQDGEYRCRENAIALTHIEKALLWMNKRVEDRAERGVLGTREL